MTRVAATHKLFIHIHCREVNVVLLDDAGVEGIEIHDQDVFVPQPSLGLEHKTTLILVALLLGLSSLLVLDFRFRLRLFPPCLVRANVLEPVEFVEKNIFVPLCTTTVQGLVPEELTRE
jgi:hypothetical protein